MKNPQAFPCDSRDSADFAGMTVRDYFAAKAMAALIHVQVKTAQQQSAESAYEWADAMLKAREQ